MTDKVLYSSGGEIPTYLDIQAETGITKHMGGYNATDALYDLCHLEHAQRVLDVGCGIGVGPVYITRRFGCQVVAVDISAKMISWSKKRALREGVADLINFRQADVCELPFNENEFDASIVESVLAFVENKNLAIQELIRVTKPGGFIGLNESYWLQEPPERLIAYGHSIAPAIITEADWRALWENSGLEEAVFQQYRVDARQELRDRIKWIGWGSLLPGWGRIIKFLLTKPGWRNAVKEQLDPPAELVELLGYGLFAGRKPQN